jgi:hypothetical protein
VEIQAGQVHIARARGAIERAIAWQVGCPERVRRQTGERVRILLYRGSDASERMPAEDRR